MAEMLYTLCADDTENALLLYNNIAGQVCCAVVPQPYTPEQVQAFLEAAAAYVLVKRRVIDEESFQGFATDKSYHETDNEEEVAITPQNLVVGDDGFCGCAVEGEFYSRYGYSSDRETREYTRTLFVPATGEPCETEYSRVVTVYGSDGEEDDSTCQVFHYLRKR